jgi:uncharacterized membrane protein
MKDTITTDDETQITDAIKEAEKNTSGEIRVHIENTCDKEVLDRATEVFAYLHMHQTKQRNGVLFYVAMESHKFAVLGDAGINAVVPPNFWNEVTNLVIGYFKQGKYAEGLSKGVLLAGESLEKYFPYAGDHSDINELDNDVSFGKN